MTYLSTPCVYCRSYERQSGHTTDLVHSRVESRPWAVNGAVEEVEEIRVCRQSAKERSIVSVHGLAKASQQETTDKQPGPWASGSSGLSNESFIVGFAATDYSDFGDDALRRC